VIGTVDQTEKPCHSAGLFFVGYWPLRADWFGKLEISDTTFSAEIHCPIQVGAERYVQSTQAHHFARSEFWLTLSPIFPTRFPWAIFLAVLAKIGVFQPISQKRPD
jgi:hypothetical protein